MGVTGMWRSNAVTLILLILLNLALMSIGPLPWTILGAIVLLGACWLTFRVGMAVGHEACGILQTVRRAQDPESPAYGQLDRKYVSQAWSAQTGLRAALISALIPYVASCVYIISMLVGIEPLILPTRLVSWVLALPFWPIIAYWYQVFDRLTPAIVAILMISPFVLPMCMYAGYLRGPKLWQKSEEAMAQGRRRAKAKSRIVRKRPPKANMPEI